MLPPHHRGWHPGVLHHQATSPALFKFYLETEPGDVEETGLELATLIPQPRVSGITDA